MPLFYQADNIINKYTIEWTYNIKSLSKCTLNLPAEIEDDNVACNEKM